MSQEYIIKGQTLIDIANAIRNRGVDVNEMNDSITPIQIPHLINNMPDLQFFIMANNTPIEDHVTQKVESYKNRFHNGPYLVMSDTVSSTRELTPSSLVHGVTGSVEPGTQITFSINTTVDNGSITQVDAALSDGFISIGLGDRISFSHSYMSNASEVYYAIIGCYEKPAPGVQGTVIHSNLFTSVNESGTTGGGGEGELVFSKINFEYENTEGYKYLFLTNCQAYDYGGEDGFSQMSYDTSSLKYVISEDKPQDEPFLVWIKNGKSDIVDNLPILYRSPNIGTNTIDVNIPDVPNDRSTGNNTTRNNNIYIKPVDVQICFSDYVWRRPYEVYIVDGDKITPIIQHDIIRTLDVEKKEEDIIPALVAEGKAGSAGLTQTRKLVTINNENIDTIGSFAFYSNHNIGSITAPYCRYIGSNAFTSCTNLQYASFENCGQIYGVAFTGCINLETAWFPNCSSVTGGSAAFSGATLIANGALGIPTVATAHPFKKAAANLESLYFPNASLIGSSAFTNNKKLHTVIAPKATTISANAFQSCTSLANLTLGLTTVTNANHRIAIKSAIQNLSFPQCTSITGYSTSASGAFYGCANLTTVDFPVCEYIGSNAFYNCNNLTTVSFPECTSIGQSAFEQCDNLTIVDFPACTSINARAFSYCSSLTSISFPVCASIGTFAFTNCIGLTTVNFPACTYIDTSAFVRCSNLTTVNFPVCVSISNYAFANCNNLTTVSFPECTSIGQYAFSGCINLTSVNFPACTSINNYAFYYCDNLISVSFPECTSIGQYTFQSCTSLTSVSFPVCTDIEYGAFMNCNNLTSVSFPECTNIEACAFYKCTSLTSVSFSECTRIAMSAFESCSSLTSVSFPKCTTIGSSAFKSCPIKELTLGISTFTSTELSIIDGLSSTIEKMNFPSYISTPNLTTFFPNFENLKFVSLPICTHIATSTFWGCESLTSIYAPECCQIAQGAFRECTSLTSVSFPVCSYISISAFYNCTSLTSVYLPQCTSIGSYTFYNCTSLTSVYLPQCTSIGICAFNRCSSLTSISLPQCTLIGNDAFYSCTSLTAVNLPQCTLINDYTFMNCTNLTSVYLPKCTSIGYSAFMNCTNLTSVTLRASTVCSLSPSAFFSTPMESTWTGTYGSIYVPASLVAAYKSATNWSAYADRITSIGTLS